MDQLTVATHNQKLEFWLARIRDCRASGMSVADWCNTNGISIKTYYYWMRKIKREAFESLPAERKYRVHAPPSHVTLCGSSCPRRRIKQCNPRPSFPSCNRHL